MKKVLFLSIFVSVLLIAQEHRNPPNSIAMKPPAGMQVGKSFEHQILILDGLKCTNCSFKDLTFLYSGGEYQLKDATFSGVIQIELHGAAENALFLKSSLSSSEANPRERITFAAPKTLSLQNTW